MNTNPLVSLIIPNFNYGCFLAEAIESGLKQTYPHIEIIVIDDGSNDNSRLVIKSFAGRIRSYAKDNGGLSSARNAGIAKAQGEWLLFLDADDTLFPNAIEELVANSQAAGRDALLAYGDSLFWQDGRTWPVTRCESSGSVWPILIRGNFLFCHEVLIPRYLLVANDGFDESLRMAEDYDLWLRLAIKCKFQHFPVMVARRRLHGAMMSQKADELRRWHGIVLEKQWSFARGFWKKVTVADACGRNFHLRAYLAKEQMDYTMMRRMSFRSVRWQPWRAKNWLYLGYACLASRKSSPNDKL